MSTRRNNKIQEENDKMTQLYQEYFQTEKHMKKSVIDVRKRKLQREDERLVRLSRGGRSIPKMHMTSLMTDGAEFMKHSVEFNTNNSTTLSTTKHSRYGSQIHSRAYFAGKMSQSMMEDSLTHSIDQ